MRIKPNGVVCGDNLEWLNDVEDESIDLCYIDPPFFSQKNYEIIWGNGFEVRSFGDRFEGDVKHYIEWMRPRVQLIHRKLKRTGLLFLHCDWHASHRLRVMLDDVFEQRNFINEIVWYYYNKMHDHRKQLFPRATDTIYFYAKDARTDYHFHQLKEAREAPIRQLVRKKVAGKLVNAKGTDGKCIYQIKDDKVIDNVWRIPCLQPASREWLNYPTQKPKVLIKRILECASNEGDLVLDCFGGGGTVAEAAHEMKRQFIVGDVSPVAIKITAERLNVDCPDARYKIYNLPRTVDQFKQLEGHEFAQMVCDLKGWKCNEKKSNDHGIDGWDGEGNPIQVKNHAEKGAGRRELQQFASAIRDSKKKRGVFVAWEFASTAKEYAAGVKQEQGLEMVLLNCSDVFGELVIPHETEAEIAKFYKERYPENWSRRVAGKAA